MYVPLDSCDTDKIDGMNESVFPNIKPVSGEWLQTDNCCFFKHAVMMQDINTSWSLLSYIRFFSSIGFGFYFFGYICSVHAVHV